MGRGDRPASAGEVLRRVDPPHEVIVADDAIEELDELIAYIGKHSPTNARAVYEAIARRLFDLGRAPEALGHIDPLAQSVPDGASARITTVKKIALYYLFPVPHQGRPMVLVLSIRRGRRLPLDEAEYAWRWLEEVARLEPPSEAPEQG